MRAIHGQRPSRARCSSSTIITPNTTISKLPARPRKPGSQSCSSCFGQGDHRGADDGTPDASSAADHGHEEILDTLIDAERRGIHETLQMRIQPARDARQQRGIDEHDDLEP